MRQMKKTKEPIVLTVNGKAEMVVHDAESYDDFLRKQDRIETIEGVRRGIADMKAGRTRPAEDVFRDLFDKYGIPEDE